MLSQLLVSLKGPIVDFRLVGLAHLPILCTQSTNLGVARLLA